MAGSRTRVKTPAVLQQRSHEPRHGLRKLTKWIALAPIVEAIAEQYAGAARVAKLNVDDNPLVMQRYRIEAIPTLILFQDGEEKDRIIGAVSKETIARAIEARVAAVPN